MFADWQATNKPGYRVKVAAVQEQIEYAARLFGITLEPGVTQGETTPEP